MSAPTEADLRRLYDRAPIGFYRSTSDGAFVFVNPALVAMLGYDSVAQVLALRLDTHVYVDASERAPLVERYLSEGVVNGVDVRWRRRDGSQRVVRLYGHAIHDDAQGIGLGFDVAAIDVTEARELERRLTRSQQAHQAETLGVLAGGMAHDFNNLLVGVLGNADLALRDIPPGEPGRAALEQIRLAALRASDLIAQLMACAGGGHLVAEAIDLGPLIEEMAALLASSRLQPIAARLEVGRDVPRAHADPSQVRQVVLNLLSNAADATAERGRVVVRTRRVVLDSVAGEYDLPPPHPGRYVAIEVADDGPGMEPSVRRRIFEPFFSTRPGGRGLGLPAVLGIVRAHGGALRVDTGPGEGSTFTVLLPSADTNELPAVPSAAGSGPSLAAIAGRAILVIDDEDLVRDVMLRMLEDLGFHAIGAPDGASALVLARDPAVKIDAVILDLTMPRMSGAECLRAIHQARPDLPVILCSGYDRDRAAVSGAAGFLRKPFRFEVLEQLLADVLG